MLILIFGVRFYRPCRCREAPGIHGKVRYSTAHRCATDPVQVIRRAPGLDLMLIFVGSTRAMRPTECA